MSKKSELLLKLKELAKRGINGEKENADKLLKKLMQKYNITEEELNAKETKIVWVTLKNEAELTICSQILYAYFNNAGLWQIHGHKTRYWTELTASQEIEFKYMLSVYLESFNRELEIFVSAFIKKNNMFPENAPVTYMNELSTEEREKALRASMMADGIEMTQIRKCITD